MATPRMTLYRDSWGSPYANHLYIIGNSDILKMIEEGAELITGVNIDVARDGVNVYWNVSYGGHWTLVNIPQQAYPSESYPRGRRPVDRFFYLPILEGEEYEGRLYEGRKKSLSIYKILITVEGISQIEPIDVEIWGEFASDITEEQNSCEGSQENRSSSSVQEETEPDSQMAMALKKAGLI